MTISVQGVPLDLPGFVAEKKGLQNGRKWGAAQYAYAGDLHVRATLGRITPVMLAIEATVRAWKGLAKSELLGRCVKVTEKQFPRVHKTTVACADRLGIEVPEIYIAPDVGVLNAHTLGTDEDSYIVLTGALVDHLSDSELTAVIGHECGHIHNGHVVYKTALHYLTNGASFFVRWIVQPAVLALQAWSRRAEITCDRAGLVCTADLDVTTKALVKLALGSQKLADEVDVDEYLKQLGEGREKIGRFAELWASHPYLPKRVAALRIFAEGAYYRALLGESGGLSHESVDERTSEIVKVMG